MKFEDLKDYYRNNRKKVIMGATFLIVAILLIISFIAWLPNIELGRPKPSPTPPPVVEVTPTPTPQIEPTEKPVEKPKKHTHKYVLIEYKEPTYTENGYKDYECIDKDDSYREWLPKLDCPKGTHLENGQCVKDKDEIIHIPTPTPTPKPEEKPEQKPEEVIFCDVEITYNSISNGKTILKDSLNGKYETETTYKILKDELKAKGYETKEDIIKVKFDNKDQKKVITILVNPIEYNITYNLDGGIVEGVNKTKYNIETPDFKIINPTKTDYTFTGWTSDKDNTPSLNVVVKQSSKGNLNFKANYKEVEKEKLSFLVNGSGFNGKVSDMMNNNSKLDTIYFTNHIPQEVLNKYVDVSKDDKSFVVMWEDENKIMVGANNEKIYADEDCSGMFGNLYNLKHVLFNGVLETSNTADMSDMFRATINLEDVDLSTLNMSNTLTLNSMFNGSGVKAIDFGDVNTSNVKDMSWMFFGTDNLSKLDTNNIDTNSVEDFSYMFDNATSLNSIDVSNWNTSKAKTMKHMFRSMTSLNSLDTSSFNTSNVEDMSGMFDNLVNVNELNIKSLDTSKVKDFSNMFNANIKLTSLDVRHFNTSSAINMSDMFSNCIGLKDIDVSSFDVRNVKEAIRMFSGLPNVKYLDLSNFDLDEYANISQMFGETNIENGLAKDKRMADKLNREFQFSFNKTPFKPLEGESQEDAGVPLFNPETPEIINKDAALKKDKDGNYIFPSELWIQTLTTNYDDVDKQENACVVDLLSKRHDKGRYTCYQNGYTFILFSSGKGTVLNLGIVSEKVKVVDGKAVIEYDDRSYNQEDSHEPYWRLYAIATNLEIEFKDITPEPIEPQEITPSEVIEVKEEVKEVLPEAQEIPIEEPTQEVVEVVAEETITTTEEVTTIEEEVISDEVIVEENVIEDIEEPTEIQVSEDVVE